MLKCTCTKNWETCPIHDWERSTGDHIAMRLMQTKAQRDIRRKRRLAGRPHDRRDKNRQEF